MTLRELAEAATPGPWRVLTHNGRPSTRVTFQRADEWGTVADVRYRNGPADAPYIAAVSPDVVMRLLDVVEAARRLLDPGWTVADFDTLDTALAALDAKEPR